MICSVQTEQFYLFIIKSALTLFYIFIAPILENQIYAVLQVLFPREFLLYFFTQQHTCEVLSSQPMTTFGVFLFILVNSLVVAVLFGTCC